MTQRISSWVPIPIESLAFMENVSPSFYRIVGAWTREIHSREEAQPMFTNGGVVGDGSHCASAKRLGVTKGLKPRTTFSEVWFDDVKIVI